MGRPLGSSRMYGKVNFSNCLVKRQMNRTLKRLLFLGCYFM